VEITSTTPIGEIQLRFRFLALFVSIADALMAPTFPFNENGESLKLRALMATGRGAGPESVRDGSAYACQNTPLS
jgi:hypothetical protein